MTDDSGDAIDYDLMVNWDRRLAREGPFFQKLFRRDDVRRVLDCACGTGRHAHLFATWGLDVVGVDVSEDRIEIARKNFRHPSLCFRVCDFLSIEQQLAGEAFDAVVCLGNALPNLRNVEQITEAVRQMAERLRPGGMLVLHLLNFPKWIAERRRIDGPRPGSDPSRDVVFLKVFDCSTDRVNVDVLQLERTAGVWQMKAGRGELFPVDDLALRRACEANGLSVVAAYEDHEETPFDRESSDNLILLARAEE